MDVRYCFHTRDKSSCVNGVFISCFELNSSTGSSTTGFGLLPESSNSSERFFIETDFGGIFFGKGSSLAVGVGLCLSGVLPEATVSTILSVFCLACSLADSIRLFFLIRCVTSLSGQTLHVDAYFLPNGTGNHTLWQHQVLRTENQ